MGDKGLPLLLGEAPSRTGDRYWMFPLSGAVAQSLCEMAGIPPQPGGTRYGQWTWALYEHFDCQNLFERYQGPKGVGADFPAEPARRLGEAILPSLGGRVVVALGARLPLALGLGQANFYHWGCSAIEPIFQFVAIPHPSGLNRRYNSYAERERAGAVLRESMQRAALEAP